jgi:hypothetical protein
VSPASGLLGVFEWKTPPAAATGNADDILAEVPEAGAASIEAEATFHAPEPGAEAMKGEITGPAQAGLPQISSDSPVLRAEGQGLGTTTASSDDIGTKKDPHPAGPDEEKPAATGLAATKAGAPGTLKASMRRPNIFVPGPAPDDPGPRPPEAEEGSTPLTRFRRPA